MGIFSFLLGDEFVRGFIAGQVVALLCILFLFQHFLLASPSSYVSIKPRIRQAEEEPLEAPETTDAAIDGVLRRLGVSAKTDLSESVGWLNILLSRFLFAQLHEDPDLRARAIGLLERAVAEATPFVRGFRVDRCELTPGEAPVIEWVRLRRFHGAALTLDGPPSTYCLEAKVRWVNAGHFGFEAAAALNWPEGSPIVLLPCALSAKILALEAVVRVSFPDTQARLLEVSLVPEQYAAELEIESSFGHRAKLRNVEKLAQLLAVGIRAGLEDSLVWPARVAVEAPRLAELLAAPADSCASGE